MRLYRICKVSRSVQNFIIDFFLANSLHRKLLAVNILDAVEVCGFAGIFLVSTLNAKYFLPVANSDIHNNPDQKFILSLFLSYFVSSEQR